MSTGSYEIWDLGYDETLDKSETFPDPTGEIPIAPLDTLNVDTGVGTYVGGLYNPVEGVSEAGSQQSGTTSGTINQADGALFSGKTSFTDTTPGYRLGVDVPATGAQFYIGKPGSSLDYNVTTPNTLTVSGSLVAGSLDIPDATTANSFHVDSSGNVWWGANRAAGYAAGVAYVSAAGLVKFVSGTIGGWTLSSTTLVGGSATLDSAGDLTLGTSNNVVRLSATDATYRLWVGNATAASAPFSVTKAGAIAATSGTIGGWTLAATTFTGTGSPSIVINSATPSIGTTDFVSGLLGKGWQINSTNAEFQNIIARGLIRTSVFEKATINSVGGYLLVSPADVLGSDMTALDASSLVTKSVTFPTNSVIRIKDGTDDEYMLVTGSVGTTHTVTRDLAGSYAPNSNPVWTKGTAVVSLGVGTGTKTGFIMMDTASANSPFIDITARNSNTYSDYTTKVRIGNLEGITDASVGLPLGSQNYGLYTSNGYFTGTIVATVGKIGGWTLGATSISDTAGTTGISSAVTAGDDIRFWAGNVTPGSAPFRVTEAGVITATSGTIGGWTLGSTTLTGTGVTLSSTGDAYIAFGTTPPTGVATGTGIFMNKTGLFGLSANTQNFKIDATDGSITSIKGSIAAFTIAGTTLSATNLTITSGAANTANIAVGTGANLAGLNSANGATDIAIWAGDTFANRATAPFRVTGAGNIALGTNGYILGGQTAYNTGTGFFLGYSGSTYKFSIGDTTAANSLTWDGTTLSINGSTVSSNDIFGNGVDGAFALDGTNTYAAFMSKSSADYTLTKDVYATSFTMSSTATLTTAGYRLFVNGTLTLGASNVIKWNGNAGGAGGNGTGGSGGTGGTGGSTGAAGAALTATNLSGAPAGAVGGTGGAGEPSGGGGLGAAAGGNGTNVAKSFAGTFTGASIGGGTGGSGARGAGTAGGLAGTNGTVSSASAVRPYTSVYAIRMLDESAGATPSALTYWPSYGAGGGGQGGRGDGGAPAGGGGGGGGGGGSGSGGGFVVVAARIIVNAGAIQSLGGAGGKGGNGGNAGAGNSGGGGGGGPGSGGPGGTLALIYSSLTGAGTTSVAGGASGAIGTGGTKSGTGTNGADTTTATTGVSGSLIQLQV